MPNRYEYFTRDGSKMRNQLGRSGLASSPAIFENEPIPDCRHEDSAGDDLGFDRDCRCCSRNGAVRTDADDEDEEYRNNCDDRCAVFSVRAEITRPVLIEIMDELGHGYGLDGSVARDLAFALRMEASLRAKMRDAIGRHPNRLDFSFADGEFVPNEWD